MKRGSGLKRTKGLDRGKALERATPLERGDKPLKRDKPLRQRPRPAKRASVAELERIAREAWKDKVGRGPCLMCREFPPTEKIREQRKADLRRREGHHVLAQRHLKREGLHGLLWDSDNGVTLCAYHHGRHEKAIQRMPLRLIPPRAIAFAQRVGLDWILEREYPA